jgi:hypothetical protein
LQQHYPTKNTFIQFDTPKKVSLHNSLRSPPKSVPHDFAPSARGLMPGVSQQYPQALPMPSPSESAEGPDGNMQTLRLSDYLSSPYIQKRQQSMVNNPWPITEGQENFPPVPPLPNNGSPTFLVFDPSSVGFAGEGNSMTPFNGQMCMNSPMGDSMPFGMAGFAMGEDMGGMTGDMACNQVLCSGPNDWQQPPQVMGAGNAANNLGNGSSTSNGNGMMNSGPGSSSNNNCSSNSNCGSQNIFEALTAALPNSKISIQSGSSSLSNAGTPAGGSGGYSGRSQRHGNKHGGDATFHHSDSHGCSLSPNKWHRNRTRGHHGRH